MVLLLFLMMILGRLEDLSWFIIFAMTNLSSCYLQIWHEDDTWTLFDSFVWYD
jgi:hypothetical protein